LNEEFIMGQMRHILNEYDSRNNINIWKKI
jgi:hypothetical protein